MKANVWPVASKNNSRDRVKRTGELMSQLLHETSAARVLDIGGNDFTPLAETMGWDYVTIDLAEPQPVGTGGHQSGTTLTYDGKTLPFGPSSFDLINVGFVLHHAAENTLGILRQIKDISRRYVLVGEDIADQHYPTEWHERNFAHHPGGIFRSDEEWCELFALYSLRLLQKHVVRRVDDCDDRHYRVIYVLDAS